MKNSIFKNWSWVRLAYIVIGSLVGIQAGISGHWWGLGLGIYLLTMGVFNLSCAAGSCTRQSCAVEPNEDHKISH